MLKKSTPAIAATRNWKSIGVDALAIIFSVLFALALDDWRERRNVNKRVETVTATIQHEIAQNKASITDALAYHEPLVNNLSNGTHRLTGLSLEENPMDLSTPAKAEASLRAMINRSGSMMFDEVQFRQIKEHDYRLKVQNRLLRVTVENDSLFVFGVGNIQLRPARILNTAWETALATQTSIHLDFELVSAMTEINRLHGVYDETVGRIIDMLYGRDGSVTPAMQDLLWFERSLLERYEHIEQLLGDAS